MMSNLFLISLNEERLLCLKENMEYKLAAFKFNILLSL